MQLTSDELRLSAGDLSDFLACRHLTRRNLAVVHRKAEAPHYKDAGFDALLERGQRHEAGVLESFKQRGWSVRDIAAFATGASAAEKTRAAMAEGVDVVYQGMLAVENEIGLPDFLIRAELLDPGRSGYEVADAKLARTAKARAVLQTAFYSRLLGTVQGFDPKLMYLALGGADGLEAFRVADYAAYEQQVAGMLGEFLAGDEDPYSEPVEHCAVCKWAADCSATRRADDDLSLVAGVTSRQRKALKDAGLATLAAFGSCAVPPKLPGVGGEGLANAHAQARIQLKGRTSGRPEWEFRELEVDENDERVPDRGLLALPEPSAGDLFFDIEGARFYSEDGKEFGLQYLFGIVDTADLDADGRPRYHAIWSFDRREEKAAFEELIDFFMQRRAKNPGLHIYHYNHYEPTSLDALSAIHGTLDEALGRLMGRFASHQTELNGMLETNAFVDLYRVVRQGVRASVESYSIKKLERMIGYERVVRLADVNERMVAFDAALDEGSARNEAEAETRAIIQGYNEDDCRSTLVLRDWLEARRSDLERKLGTALPRPVPPPPKEDKTDPEIAALFARLMEGLPEDPAGSSSEQNGRRLVANLLEWHRRENNPKWWNWFRMCELSDEELREERGALSGLTFVGEVGKIKQSFVMQYRFPPQDHPFRSGKSGRTRDDKEFEIRELDDAHGTIEIVQGPTRRNDRYTALIDFKFFSPDALSDRLKELGAAVVGFSAEWPASAASDLILRRRPRIGDTGAGPLLRAGESATDAGVRLALALEHSYLAIQGPPGSGKTYTAAHQVLALVEAGKTVGVTANSHAVIGNLLKQICALDPDRRLSLGQVGTEGQVADCIRDRGTPFKKGEDALAALSRGAVQVLGGTPFFWAREKAAGAVDTLIVDEAGQMSLANTLAVAHAARNLILVGDPQQLAQPSQGAHPPGAGASALEHILENHAVMPDDRGLFIGETRRMHPDICAFTSEVFYDGKLEAVAGLERQAILDAGGWSGTGLRFHEVPHEGNTDSSREEAEAVTAIVAALCRGQWRNERGEVANVGPDQVLIVTPFNAQVHEIRAALDAAGHTAVKVGTVDKFQGQEAPVTLYSMASSSAEHAPRGLEFLYERNRLNVATSRARCLTIVVASPDLVRVLCRTSQQMILVNALCSARKRAAENS